MRIPQNRGYKNIGVISNLFQLFMMGLNRDAVQPILPYSGGMLEQPYWESVVWELFLEEYIKLKKEEEKKLKIKKPNVHRRF